MDPIGMIGIGLAVIPPCIKLGKLLIQKYKAYKGADREIIEFIIRIEAEWIKLEIQTDFLEKIWHTLEERLQIHQSTLIHKLHVQLQDAKGLLDGVDLDGVDLDGVDLDGVEPTRPDDPSMAITFAMHTRWRKLKYALSFKECLKKSLKNLQMWREMFDPSWYLIIRVSRDTIDQHLADQREGTEKGDSVDTFRAVREAVNPGMSNNKSIFLSPNYLGERKEDFGLTSLQTVERCKDGCDVLVDIVHVRDVELFDKKKEDVRNLARVLSHVAPLTFGLLKCDGVVVVERTPNENGNFKFIFEIPGGLKSPRSLRSLLAATTKDRSLNEKLDIAQCLANSVLFVHTANYVHKNIRPETIVVFDTDDEAKPSVSFLVGFENFRPAEGQTWLLGDLLWEKDLYRHPQRQGARPQGYYVMQHDIYSLGVCLLEIGLWTTFVIRTDHSTSPTPCPELEIAGLLKQNNHEKRASDVKGRLIEMTEKFLPGKMGNKYTDVVLSCLKCLDKEGNGFGDSSDFHDADGILVGVRFIEDILLRIQEISV